MTAIGDFKRTKDISGIARGLMTAAVGIVLACGGTLHAAPRHSDQQNPAAPKDNAQSKPADQNTPKPANNGGCPPGQVSVTKVTPFGPMQACEAGEAAAAPPQAQEPAAPATAPKAAPENAPKTDSGSTPKSDGVTVQTGAPKPTPAQTPSAAAPGATSPSTAGAAPAAVQPTTSQQAPSTPTPEAARQLQQAASDGAIQLNLENADLYQVLRILGPELKINTIIDPAVKGSVTINTSTTVSRKDLFGLLEMILEINGATMVRQPNGYYAIVPMGAAKQQPTEFYFAKQSAGAPSHDEGFVLHVVAMKFMSAGEMSKILTPYMSPGGQIVVQDKGNLLLISEGAAKMGELEQLINVFDDPVLGRQRVRLIQVKYNLATNIIPELKAIFSGYGLTGNPAVQLIAMERQNAILAISGAPEVFKEVEDWVKKLDQPSQEVGIRNFVYKVQNARASDLATILSTLYGKNPLAALRSEEPAGGAGGPTTGVGSMNPATVMGPPNGQTGAVAPPAGAAPVPSAASGPAQEPAATQFSSNLKVMADDKNNQLVIQTTPHDYELLERTLRELDVLPRQVMIDARIYQVDLTGDLSLGLSAYLDKKGNRTPINTKGSFDTASGLVMQTFAILHNSYELQLFLNASENRSRVKTLSSPSILVTDNTAARVQVGSEVPVPIGSALTPVQSGGSSVFAQTIQMRDVGVILSVTPRINASGIVTMEIQQEVSSAQPNSTSAIVAPVISKSQFQTKAILRDGETLALGGIIETSNNLTKNRIPLIGDIPGVGALFGNTSWSTTRKELVLLITPHVARDMNEANGISSGFLDQMKNLKKDLQKLPSKPTP